MKYRDFSKGFLLLLLIILASSFTSGEVAKKFTPVGSWEYSVPGVEPGYENGIMIVARDGKDYKVAMQLNEYFKADAENVVYKKKSLSFSVWVETEEIKVSGTFDKDIFSATITYSAGDFNMTAKRILTE